MNNSLFAIATIFWTLGASPAIPPMESLFRNGSNRNIEQDTTVLKLRVQELQGENSLKEINYSKGELFDRYYKFIFNRDQNKDFELLQVEYTSAQTNYDSITKLYERRSFLRHLTRKKGVDSEKDFFWGVITSLVLNNSDAISTFLKKTNRDYRANREILNRERRALYDSYKRYLQTIKDEPALKSKFISPLAPADKNELKKVRKLLQSPFYLPSSKVSLVKEGDEFYALVKLEKVRGKFTNGDFKLVELSYSDLRGDIELKLFGYRPLSGIDELPRSILFNYFGKKYHIQMLSLKRATYSGKGLAKVRKSLRMASRKGNKKVQGRGHSARIQSPEFLF